MFNPLEVAVSNPAAAVTADSHEQVWKRHAVVPKFERIFAQLIEDWIYEDSRLIDLHEDQSFHYPNLRRRDRTSGAVTTAKIKQGIVKVLYHRTQRFDFVVSNFIARLQQEGIAEQKYFANSHTDYLEYVMR